MNWHYHKSYYMLLFLFLVTNLNIVLLFFLVRSFLVTGPVSEPMCGAVPMHQWAKTTTVLEEELPTPVDLVIVTHTVTDGCDTDAECENMSREIREMHLGFGFWDIGLSFLVGGNGKIYEGAGWKVGAHTRGYNNRSISLSFIGDFGEQLPKDEALEAAKNFLGCVLNYRYLGCTYRLVGHRQLTPTLSPGEALHRHIQTWPHWTEDASSI